MGIPIHCRKIRSPTWIYTLSRRKWSNFVISRGVKRSMLRLLVLVQWAWRFLSILIYFLSRPSKLSLTWECTLLIQCVVSLYKGCLSRTFWWMWHRLENLLWRLSRIPPQSFVCVCVHVNVPVSDCVANREIERFKEKDEEKKATKTEKE